MVDENTGEAEIMMTAMGQETPWSVLITWHLSHQQWRMEEH